MEVEWNGWPMLPRWNTIRPLDIPVDRIEQAVLDLGLSNHRNISYRQVTLQIFIKKHSHISDAQRRRIFLAWHQDDSPRMSRRGDEE